MESLRGILTMEDRAIQAWLRHVEPGPLALALADADAATREAVYRNLSPRAQTMLAADVAESAQAPAASRTEALRTVLAALP